jgi:hypothetical protein
MSLQGSEPARIHHLDRVTGVRDEEVKEVHEEEKKKEDLK